MDATIAAELPEPTSTRPGRRLLAIYVLADCLGCETARRLAAVAEEATLDIDVQVIDLGAPGAVRPPAVFAVPTYLLDGRVISLGNPDPAWLLALLADGGPTPEIAPNGHSAPSPRTRRRRR